MAGPIYISIDSFIFSIWDSFLACNEDLQSSFLSLLLNLDCVSTFGRVWFFVLFCDHLFRNRYIMSKMNLNFFQLCLGKEVYY